VTERGSRGEAAAAVKDLLSAARRILVIKLRYVGDSLWMLPFLANLRSNLPAAEITVLVNEGTEGFFRGCPDVDRVIPFPYRRVKSGLAGIAPFLSTVKTLRRSRPDAVIDLTDSDRPALLAYLSGAKLRLGYTYHRRWRNRLFTHIIVPQWGCHLVRYHLDFLEAMGLSVTDDAIRLRIAPEVVSALRRKAPAVFAEENRKKIVVHPGARISLRQWGADRYARLCDQLSVRYSVFLVTGPDEAALLAEVLARVEVSPAFSSSSLSLEEFAALCGTADAFVGNDSGPIHMAAPNTFVVGLYGPNTDAHAGPWTDRKFIFEVEGLPCRPCDQSRCVNPEFKACLRRVSAEAVAGKILEIVG
jgi:predicted lipopolysaccharide heptosyltransferase III